MNSNKKEISYEQIVKRLEEVIEALESEKLDLDKSIELYEEGANLYHEAQEILSVREEKALQIIDLLQKEDPQLTIDDVKEE